MQLYLDVPKNNFFTFFDTYNQFKLYLMKPFFLYSQLTNFLHESSLTLKLGLPVIIAGDKIATGAFKDDREYFDFLELAFDIEPVQH